MYLLSSLFVCFGIASSAVSFLVAIVIIFTCSRRSRHTNLVSFVSFPSFLVALFVFRFDFLCCIISLFMCVCFQRIASKSANLLDVGILISLGPIYIVSLAVQFTVIKVLVNVLVTTI